MKKIIALLLIAVFSALCFSSCAGGSKSDYEYVKEKGTMIVGITDFAPMDYKDGDGNWTGFDAELARLVGAKLGVNVEFYEISWDRKIFEINSKAIDCVWNGMTLNDEVLDSMSCTDPYVKNKQVVVMRSDLLSQYTTVESMKELKFAAEAGSAGENAIKDNGLDGNYTAVQSQTQALLEVSSGAVDACVIDSTLAASATGENTGYQTLGAGLVLTDEFYGIGFRKNSDITEKVNGILKELKDDGTLAALAEKYGLQLAD